MTDPNVRWQQRFSSYKRSLSLLSKFIEKESLNELEALGSIHVFEMTLGLAGKLLHDYARTQDIQNIYSFRDAACAASNLGLIDESDIWLEMLRTRQQENEFHRPEVIEKIATDIKERFFGSMLSLQNNVQAIQSAS